MDNTAAILLLSELPGVGDKTLGGALRRCAVRGAEVASVLDLSPADLRDLGFGVRSVEAVRAVSCEMRAAAVATARGLNAAGVLVLTASDALFPRRLLERLADPPAVLYAYGTLDVLSKPTFAVANSNAASESALALSDAAAESLVRAGWRPVTGHNRPAYQRTALAALRFGSPVCYVLDRGLLEAFEGDLRRELFPAAHVWSNVYDPSTTLTLSTFPLRAHGIALYNRRRDELIFSLVDVVLVGDVSPGGQMERCIREALAQKRRVCLVGPPLQQDETLYEAGALRGVSSLL